jgi:hypothetical protein
VKEGDSEEMAIIKEVKSVHGKLIDELVRKVTNHLQLENSSN